MQHPQRTDAGVDIDLPHRTHDRVREGRRILRTYQNDTNRFGLGHLGEHILRRMNDVERHLQRLFDLACAVGDDDCRRKHTLCKHRADSSAKEP